MVQEFSDFARMPKPSPEKFDVVSLLEEITFSQHVVNPDIHVMVKASDASIDVFGDERLLGQAIGNIVKNAADAISGLPASNESEGLISVNAEHDGGQNLTILVTDNGPGFSPELKDQFLEPYVTTREKGTGLGLAIVNRIIMDHGGTIDLQDRTDGQKGAVVRVSLPIRLPDEQPAEEAQLESAK